MTKTALGEMIATKRASLNMTQGVLATACGTSERTIIRVERGERPSNETLMALCSVLGIAPGAARAAMPPSNPRREAHDATPPPFGPVAEAARQESLRTALSREPDAIATSAPDVRAALASPQGAKRLEEAFGIKGRTPSSHDELEAMAAAAEGLASRLLRKVSRQTRVIFGIRIEALIALGSAPLFTAGAFAIQPSVLGQFDTSGKILLALLALASAFVPWATFKAIISMAERSMVEFLLRDAIAVSTQTLTIGRGQRAEQFDARSCTAVLTEMGDGHLDLTVTSRDGRRRGISWLPADAELKAALTGFCALSERNANATPADAITI